MDFLIFILVSGLVILSIVLLLRFRLKKASVEQNTINESGKDMSGPTRYYNLLKFYFIIGGAYLIVFGIIHTLGIITGDVTYIQIWDAIFNTALGLIYLVCVWFHNKRNKIVLWIYGFSVLLSIGYALAVGRGFNFYITIFGAVIIYLILDLIKKNELE